MRAGLLLAVLLLAGCAGVESELKRAAFRENMMDLVQGKDRGAGNYNRTIEKYSSKIESGRYNYVPPAYMSQWMIERAVRGLGGTKRINSDYLAFVVDRLFYVLAHDPTGSTRSLACEQLGRILSTLPVPEELPPMTGSLTDVEINTISQDLIKLGALVAKGKKVKVSAVIERMDALAQKRPPTFLSARQMVRALAAQPIAGSTSPAVRAKSEAIAPRLVRDSILVALAEVACGHPIQIEYPEDPDALVRTAALEVLTSVGSGVSQTAAVERLKDPLDPLERDPDVRRRLVAYVGAVGGESGFDACAVRLDDVELGIRYLAQQGLVRMTGAQVIPTRDAWEAWAKAHPAWWKQAREQ